MRANAGVLAGRRLRVDGIRKPHSILRFLDHVKTFMVSPTRRRTFCGPLGKGTYGSLKALAFANHGAWRLKPFGTAQHGGNFQGNSKSSRRRSVFAFGRTRGGVDVADVDGSHVSMLVDFYARMYTGILSG